MELIKANISRLKADDLLGKAKYVVGKMTGNASFPSPVPSLATISAAQVALETAIAAAQSGAHEAIANKNIRAGILRDMLGKLARYVNSVAGGDLSMALSSGFEEAKGHEPIVKLEASQELRGRMSDFKGQVVLRWKTVRGARMYQVYMSTGDPNDSKSWEVVGVSSRTTHSVSDLDSGKFYSFRVTALGAAGEGPASEIVTSKAA
jgi:Fibronectin type III domain